MALIQHKLRDRSLFKNNRQGRISIYGTPIDGQTAVPTAPQPPGPASLLIDNSNNFFIDENSDFIEVT